MLTLGREMKKARAGLGLKQKDLQEMTGISQKYLSRIENDKADPGWHMVMRIACALDLNLQAFVQKEAGTHG
jgi:predicted transcriptional regulator